MKTLAMLFALVSCAVLQAVVPAWAALGYAKPPLLLGVTLYYALNYDRRLMLQAAILAGLFQDALGMIPLGYSSFAFCLAGLATARFKELIFVQQWMTHTLAGALAAGGVTFILSLLLTRSGVAGPEASWVALRILGSMLLGAVTTPFVFRGVANLDRKLGNAGMRMA